MTDEKQIEEIEKIAKIVGWHCNEKSMDYNAITKTNRGLE